MPEQYRLTALPSRPNRVLPIGTIAEGKHAGEPCLVHVHTGSTRLVDAADVPALQEHLAQQGIAGDYQIVPLQRTAVASSHKRGQFAPPGSRSRTPAASPSPSSGPEEG